VGDMSENNFDTQKMLNRIIKADNIKGFVEDNITNYNETTFNKYITSLIYKKGIKKSDIVKDSGLSTPYVYQIISGTKKPKRNKLIQLSFGLQLNYDETQNMLKLAEIGTLYPRNKRDSVIIYAIKNGKTIYELDDMLDEIGEITVLEEE
jgi:transcriptional regulator with XRE-family HTH domain